MKIAAVIQGPTMKEALEDISVADSLDVNLIELRLDTIEKPDLETLVGTKRFSKIATIRHQSDGGLFTGMNTERIPYFRQAIELGADYVDIEYSHFADMEGVMRYAREQGKSIILSSHNLTMTPPDVDILRLHSAMAEEQPDMVKVVTYATSRQDSMRMLELLPGMASHIPTIAHCMGKYGTITRTNGYLNGSAITFAAISEKRKSAEGQLTIAELQKLTGASSGLPSMRHHPHHPPLR